MYMVHILHVVILFLRAVLSTSSQLSLLPSRSSKRSKNFTSALYSGFHISDFLISSAKGSHSTPRISSRAPPVEPGSYFGLVERACPLCKKVEFSKGSKLYLRPVLESHISNFLIPSTKGSHATPRLSSRTLPVDSGNYLDLVDPLVHFVSE